MKMMTRLLSRFVYNLELTQSQKDVGKRRDRLESRQTRSSTSSATAESSLDVGSRHPALGRHSRTDSISTSVENFTAKDAHPVRKLAKMKSFDESVEGGPAVSDVTRSASAGNIPTSASIRSLREKVHAVGLPSLVTEDEESRSATPYSVPTSPAEKPGYLSANQAGNSTEDEVSATEEPSPASVRSDIHGSPLVGDGNLERTTSSSSREEGTLHGQSEAASLAPSEAIDDDDLPPGRVHYHQRHSQEE